MTGESMVESLPPLLMLLDEAKAKATRRDTNTELFGDIERDIGFIKDIFLRLERWERDVQNELGEIAKHLDDMSEDDDSNEDDVEEEEEFRLKLETIYQKVSRLKTHMAPPLRLPPTIEPSITTLAPPTPVVASSGALNEGLAYLYATQMRNTVSDTMKDCLFYLSILPANAVVKKRLLIHWWIGEGLCITEEEGEMILHELVCRKLITPIFRAHTSALDDLSVPTKVRDELIRLATNVDPYGFPYEHAHVRLFNHEGIEIVADRRNLNRLLTCINVDRHYLKFQRSEFIKMRSIVILHLGRWQMHGCSDKHHHIEVDSTDFLDWLGSYFQSLRYLSLQGISRIMELPSSIGRLTNLTFLDLRACHNLEKLPQEITMLSKLIYLDVSECGSLDHMPKGLSLLSELKVLKGFVIGSNRNQDPCGLRELSTLKKLRKLSISIRRDSLVSEGEVGELRSLTTLRSLTITWEAGISQFERRSQRARDRMSMTMIKDLLLPPYLHKLDLRCFPGYMGSPQWLSPRSLSQLKKLYIRGGLLRTLRVPMRGPSQWSIEVLRLRFLNRFDMDESELLNEFPDLRYLEIHECNKLRSTARRLG